MNKKAYVTWGGWDGHEPNKCSAIMVDILKKEGYDLEYTESMEDYEDREKMKTFDLIVPCWTMSTITKEQSAGLRDTIKSGVGLAGWHGGLCDAFRHDVDYQYMTGGQWVAHPGGIVEYVVEITSTDPIVAGLSSFAMKSEQYYMHTDPSNDVLATTTFSAEYDPWIDGTVMPVVWKRPFGEGRVFYSSLGHVADDFDVPEVKEIMRRGLLWATR